MSNNTRTLRNRSSRFSSPAAFAITGGEASAPGQELKPVQRVSENGVDRQSQYSADQGTWVEPVVRNGVPSFEDTKGLERVGVLEHMQPLGAAPNPKLLQRLKINLGNRASLGSARATPVVSEGVGSPASLPTEPVKNELQSPLIDPELLDNPSPPSLQPKSESQSQSPVSSQAVPVLSPVTTIAHQSTAPPAPQSPPTPKPPTSPQDAIGHLISYRYNPTTSFSPVSGLYFQQPSNQVIMSPPRGRPAKKEVEEMRAYNPDDSMMSPAMASIMRSSRASPRYSSHSISEQSRGDRFRASIQNAIDRAISSGRPDIEAGLKTVLDESGRDELTTALDNISKYKANVPSNQFKVFKHFVKKGIRRHRKSSSGLSLSTNNDRGPSDTPLRPAAYDSRTKGSDSPTTKEVTQEADLSPRSNQVHHMIGDSPTKSGLEPAESFDYAPTVQLSPYPERAIYVKQGGEPNARRRRSTSTLSSSLSASDLSTYSPPEMDEQAKAQQPIEERPVRSAAQRQAPSRRSTGRPTRSSGIGTDSNSHPDSSAHQPIANYAGIDTVPTHKNKKLKLTHTDAANDEAIARQRSMYEQTIVRNSAYREMASFSRTPSPARRTRNEAEDAERRDRGLSPRAKRRRPGPPPPVIHPEALIRSAIIEASSPISAQGDSFHISGNRRKRDYDEFNGDGHSDQLSSLGPTPPPPVRVTAPANPGVGTHSTRSSTPRAAKEARPVRTGTRRTRIMDTSPQKPKNGAVAAGVAGDARAGIDQDFAVANGDGLDKTNEENRHEEECRACGDVGRLLCCDGEGCVNSFHGDCLEPPVDPDDPNLDLWYCPECEKRQRPDEAHGDNRLMGALINYATGAPPRVYTLPVDVRNYFENVKTGDDGEYVEVAPAPTSKKFTVKADSHGAVKPHNFKDLKDSKGNTRFCYRCNETTEGQRDMMPCDFCSNEWHLDCLTPPLATVPRRIDASGRPNQHWRCPLHIEHDLRNVSQAQHAVPGQMGRIPRIRRPNKPTSITPKEFIAQNPTNNGLIEPVLDPEQIDLDLKTVEMNGVVFKIPEQQIKLDFIAKARREFYIDHAIPQIQGRKPIKFHYQAWTPDDARIGSRLHQLDNMDYEMSNMQGTVPVDSTIQARADAELRLRQKSFLEQRTALALVDLVGSTAQTNGDVGHLDASISVGGLVNRLVADAPDNVAETIYQSEEKQLERLMNLAQQRLNILKGRSSQNETAVASNAVFDSDSGTKNNDQNQIPNGKINGDITMIQVNGTTLGHDHGDD